MFIMLTGVVQGPEEGVCDCVLAIQKQKSAITKAYKVVISKGRHKHSGVKCLLF